MRATTTTTLLKYTKNTLTSLQCYHSHPTAPPPTQQQSALLNEFTKHCYQQNLTKAMQAMQTMQTHHIYADSITYSKLFKLCISNDAIKHAKLVHNHIFSNGYRPKTFLVNVVIGMYVKFGLLGDAEKVFDEMGVRDVVSWTTMIAGYANAGMGRKAMEGLVMMGREGVQGNMYTYSCVLRVCDGVRCVGGVHCRVVKVGLELDVFVRSALIDVYAKWGEVDMAVGVFVEMPTRDAVVWNSVIAGFVQNSRGDEALEYFKRMKRAGFKGEQSSLTSVLRGCTGLVLLELGRQVHVHVIKYDHDLILNNALLDMYCKCGSYEDARALFDRMRQKDVISWSTMIAGLAQNGYSHEALMLFEDMKASGTKPNNITMLGLLFACSHAGLVDEGWNYFLSMKRLGINPEREHYGCMIDLLGRAGRLDEAFRLINQMECEPDAVSWRTLLGACRVHKSMDLAVHAARQVLKLDPHDAGTYILLSNIYAKSQRWEDAKEVRQIMRATGIKKEPGCSWIEINKMIHAFILGDNSHPQIDEINKKLNLLVNKLIGVGYVPDTDFVLQDLEGEQREDSLRYHSEKLAIMFGLMSLPKEMTIRIRKNLRICGDCHAFAKLVTKMEDRTIVIRDLSRYHHFMNGVCSCGDYW